MSESSWTGYDSEGDLQQTDQELVQQMFEFIDANRDADKCDMILKMTPQYRFAGYIGSIQYLFSEIDTLKREIAELKQPSWLTRFLKNMSRIFLG